MYISLQNKYMFNNRNQNIFDCLTFLNDFDIEFVPLMKLSIADLLTNQVPCIHNQHLKNIRNHLD